MQRMPSAPQSSDNVVTCRCAGHRSGRRSHGASGSQPYVSLMVGMVALAGGRRNRCAGHRVYGHIDARDR